MTGLECLQEEMLRRGCTAQQVRSKAVAVVLDILTKTNDRSPFEREWELKAKQEEIDRKTAQYKVDKDYWLRMNQDISEARSVVFEEKAKLEREKGEMLDQIKAELMSELEKCETSEARDRIRKARYFRESITVDSKYDNTAYIIGLASILSGNERPMDDLKKMNKKLFEKGVN